MGDFNGIGPEIALKCVTLSAVGNICMPILVGSIEVFERVARNLSKRIALREIDPKSLTDKRWTLENGRGDIGIIPIRPFEIPKITFGKNTNTAGRYAGEAIQIAAGLCKAGSAGAMVTAPVSKTAMYGAGFRHLGQTEMLAKICGSKKHLMILVTDKLRVALATVHRPLRFVYSSITRKLLDRKSTRLNSSHRL